ncbi:LysM peptidoglycan-binding domain-containing protein [Nocardioides jensenii]|uniref:LysM peptidoglycan-binding domain-containing protein n=1 Tax=Nocardioides jensenii TaxID=1843 RepID=UPI0008306C0B|nr:LysM peptidoglycan-binding domain-containing protein [Nocardioides jensenii]
MSTITLSPTTLSPTTQRSTTQRSAGQVRLTRRGRLAVFVAAMLVVLAAAFLFGASSMATNHAGVDQPTRAVTVEAGDTLWAIAADLAEDGEVREMVHTIKELNALDSSMLVAGQEIYVPLD